MVSHKKPLLKMLWKLGLKSAWKQYRMHTILRAMPLRIPPEWRDDEPEHIP
jgi:hypothetical protein